MDGSRRFRVLLNAQSGDGTCTPHHIRELFSAQGCACEVTLVTRKLDLNALATADPAETIWVAAGGDGTINAVANAIAGTGRTMAVLPSGTLNHFAQDLGLPASLDGAIEFAANGPIRAVDAADVNGRVFVNNSSLGFYPAMVADRDRMKKRGLNKWWSLGVASLRAFVRFPCVRVEVEVNGQRRECRTALLFVGNNEYQMDGGKAGKRSRLDSGLLASCMIRRASRAGMLRLLAAALAGRTRQEEDLECFQAASFTVHSRQRHLRVSFDGEVHRLRSPLRYTARPGSLRVIAPTAEAK